MEKRQEWEGIGHSFRRTLEVDTNASYCLSFRDEKDMFVLEQLACSSIPDSVMNSRVAPYGPEFRNWKNIIRVWMLLSQNWPLKFSYLPESSNICAEANFYHNGFDRIDGIFYDTGNTRGPLQYSQGIHTPLGSRTGRCEFIWYFPGASLRFRICLVRCTGQPGSSINRFSGVDPWYSQEEQDADVQTHVEIVNFTKNFWRDYVLDRDAVVITNVGGVANPRQIMEAHHDSLTLKEHNIDQGFKNDFYFCWSEQVNIFQEINIDFGALI